MLCLAHKIPDKLNQRRIDELKAGNDVTLETTQEEVGAAKHLSYTTNLDDLRACNCYIVTVPTPIDEHKRPDLTPLIKASETVGRVLKRGETSEAKVSIPMA